MATNARQDLKVDCEEFAHVRFPKLGYKVDGFPEADSVLAGMVSQALARRKGIAMSDVQVISAELAAAVISVCQQQRGSQDAVELEAYLEKMQKLESDLRHWISQSEG